MDAGYFYAPYTPLTQTPVLFGEEQRDLRADVEEIVRGRRDWFYDVEEVDWIQEGF